ncbi:DUF4349 domain-containing protein [Streptomyces sp. NBC_00121]|uniref:DUF4349 domain-containing protein n=1 Tax=unclassified Streptomyces TaxID=2593676 RepID=UPI002DD8A463|nr:DUF4349 domain-containing protein [Streptomyces sp. NBC_01760]WSC72419.1 DUF4349 domain-containing protein [Streptomyces sp. NBC_01760]WTI90148.1 DUF4349 domain-containing protein [Streptomyces sp. NBC_00724]
MQPGRHPDRLSAHRSRTALAAATLAALLVLSGCGGSDSSDSSKSAAGDGKYAAPRAERGDAAAGAADQGSAESGSAEKKKPSALSTPHVIRKASLSVEVKSVPKAVAAARAAVESAGGLVASESTERLDATHEASHIVLRVPQGEYDAVLQELAGGGKLLSRTTSAKDVTDQVVDVESRIATQRASVTRVRKLMDRADKLADVVTLEGELSNRQAELESLLAQQESLKDRTTLATITLSLSEPESPSKKEDDDPGFMDALGGGWHAFVTTVRWIAMAVGAAAPFLAAAAGLLLLGRLLRTWLARRRVPRQPQASQPEERTPAAPEAPTAP